MNVQPSGHAVFRIRPVLLAALTFLAMMPSSFAAPEDLSADGVKEEVERATLGTVTTPLALMRSGKSRPHSPAC